jgi:hypothetical protein
LPSASILGNRYSFERLGLNNSPAQACPYPLGSRFVQDAYPANPDNLHQPTQAEFNQIINRMFGRLVMFGAVNTLAGVGQSIGDVYVDIITSAAPVVSDVASTLTSEFFYSFRAVLNSASGSQTPMALRNGPTPQDAGSGSEPPCVWLPIVVPTNAVVLSFDFTFTGSPGSDVLTTSIGGTNVFALEAQFIPQNQKLNSGSIPVANWAGKTVELFFGLVGGSSSNATVTIDAMRFYQLTPPRLSITTSGSKAVVSWPASAQDYVLESANSLIGTNQWSAVTNTQSTNALWIQMTNSVSGSAKFYRLKK